MIVFIGTKVKIKENARAICPVGEKYCMRCNKGTQHVLCHAELWATFCFIPIFSLGHRFGMRCSSCGKTSDFYIKKRKEPELLESLNKDGYVIETEEKKEAETKESNEKNNKQTKKTFNQYVPVILIIIAFVAMIIMMAK